MRAEWAVGIPWGGIQSPISVLQFREGSLLGGGGLGVCCPRSSVHAEVPDEEVHTVGEDFGKSVLAGRKRFAQGEAVHGRSKLPALQGQGVALLFHRDIQTYQDLMRLDDQVC